MNGGGGGNLGLGDGLASQLLSVSAFKPIIDKILTEAGFADRPDALTSLTNALAAAQLANPTEAAVASACRCTARRQHHLGHRQGDARTEVVVPMTA